MKRGGPLKRGNGLKPGAPLKRGRWLRRGGPIKPMSAKRQEEVPERTRVLEQVFARDGRKCRVAPFLPDMPCGGRLTGHEPLTRARGGDPLDPDQVVTVCLVHHDWIHTHPDEATALGLLVHSWAKPSTA